jgi:hypothetical protein
MQLDIFDDGRGTMLAHDLASALLRDALADARTAAAALAAEFPADARLAPAALLIDALAARSDAPFPDAAAALAAREELDARLVPAAVVLFGRDDSRRWRATRLAELAARAARLPWSADAPLAHAAAFFVAAAAWHDALQSIAAIESWRRKPQPLAWAAEATWQRDGSDAGWPLVAELAWLAPARIPPLVAALDDAKLTKLATRFEADLDADDWRRLPAWLLIEQPLLAAALDAAQPSRDDAPERAFRTLRALLRLERQGRHHELIEHRRRLREHDPTLFALYMKTR